MYYLYYLGEGRTKGIIFSRSPILRELQLLKTWIWFHWKGKIFLFLIPFFQGLWKFWVRILWMINLVSDIIIFFWLLPEDIMFSIFLWNSSKTINTQEYFYIFKKMTKFFLKWDLEKISVWIGCEMILN